jgi:Tfp pilus assembly protein PilF
MFQEAVSLQQRGNHKGAVKRFKRVLNESPNQPQVLNLCARSLCELGDLKTAERMLGKAIESDPDSADSWGNMGMMLQMAGKPEEATDAFDKCRKLNPASFPVQIKYADLCQKLKRFGEAMSAYELSLEISPNDPDAWKGLSRACMFEGKWERALEAADRALPTFPGDTVLLSIKSVALYELGQKNEADELVDFDRFIEQKNFSAPAGYADLKSFNDTLCDHCLAHPTLEYEPDGLSTKIGHQTGNLAEGEDQGPIAHLLELIEEEVRNYQKSHAIDPSHPFLSQQPEQWEIYIWATVLESQGHQSSHLHPGGWLSGVYYAKIPDVISADSEDKSGWIEFGCAAKYPDAEAEHEVRLYQPSEGKVVLFPSYFYHRTEPFDSEDKRISIAFDIIPIT